MSLPGAGLSLRVRLMIVGVSGLAGALALGGLLLYGVLGLTIRHSVDAEARAGAEQVARLVDQGPPPDPLPVAGSQVAQVLDSQDRVVAASLGSDRLTALLRPGELTRARAGHPLTVPGSRIGLDGALRAVAVPAGRPGGALTVVVAQQTADTAHSQRLLRTTLLVGYPLLVALLALIAWHVIGRTLRPVEELRRGAARISGAGDEERLPVPRAADEIRALATTLNEMLDRLDASRGAQKAFVADAAHELRSPLASMRTQLEVAGQLGEGGELADDLLAEVERLTALTEDLLLLARGDVGGAAPRPAERLPIGPLLDEVAQRRRSSPVPVEVAAPVAGPPVTVTANRSELRRVLDNLVDNAVRHARGRVELAAVGCGGSSLVTVTDDGPGIPTADRERVFERFTRLDDARDRDAGGAGLGLAIVRDLLARAGGTIAFVDADPGAEPPGLRAEVRLPR